MVKVKNAEDIVMLLEDVACNMDDLTKAVKELVDLLKEAHIIALFHSK